MSNTAIIKRKITMTHGHYLIHILLNLSFLNISPPNKSVLSAHQYHTRGEMCEGGLKAEVEWEESSSGPICGFQRTSEEEEPGERHENSSAIAFGCARAMGQRASGAPAWVITPTSTI